MVQERCQVMVLHDKKRKIMEAAKQVFAEKSYFEATLENISQISGVKKSTIYYYFGSKLDLMIGLIDQMIKQSLEGIDTLELTGSPKEKLATIIDAHFKFLTEQRELMIVFQRAGYDFLLHHNVLKEFKDVMKKYENLRDRLGNKIGTLETKNGYTITGKEIFQILASSMWGYCMEESKEGRFLTQENKEIFKEIFTSFIKE